jgi:TPR repeat protein
MSLRALFPWLICFCLPCFPTSDQAPALLERANADDVEAQCVLGAAYANGTGVAHDDGESLSWLRKAAAHNIAWVQHRIGSMYHGGKGVVRNDAEAVKWYRAAAEQHEPRAEADLAYMYFQGQGVSRRTPMPSWYNTARLFCAPACPCSAAARYQFAANR